MRTISQRTGYHSWVIAIGFGAAVSATGCSSGTQASPAPSGSGAAVSSTAASSPADGAPAEAPAGALPLQVKNAQKATYTIDGAPKEFLVFSAEKVTVSASCGKPDGGLDCEAMQLLRRGKSVQLTPAESSRGIPPGAAVCAKLKIMSTTGRDAKGNEDGFCTFADGSLVSHGSVDTHVLAP